MFQTIYRVTALTQGMHDMKDLHDDNFIMQILHIMHSWPIKWTQGHKPS